MVVIGRRSLVVSNFGGIRESSETLDFCSAYGTTANSELINIQCICTAYEPLKKGGVKYGFVIDMVPLKN